MPIFNRYFLVPDPNTPKSGTFGHNVLFNAGPRLPVEVKVPNALANYLTHKGQPVPSPVSGEALVDTGASVSCVDETVMEKFGVNPVGIAQVGTPSTARTPQFQYPVLFAFPGTTLPQIEIAHALGSVLEPQGLLVLIGRDILSNFVFIYNGVGGFVTLSY
jgi:hypothetical protein